MRQISGCKIYSKVAYWFHMTGCRDAIDWAGLCSAFLLLLENTKVPSKHRPFGCLEGCWVCPVVGEKFMNFSVSYRFRSHKKVDVGIPCMNTAFFETSEVVSCRELRCGRMQMYNFIHIYIYIYIHTNLFLI